MVLADWLDVAGTINGISSPNDAPVGGANPTLQLEDTGTAETPFMPSGTTVNGVNITGIKHGKIISWVQLDTVADGQTCDMEIIARYSDASNFLKFCMVHLSGGTGTQMRMAVRRVTAGVDTDIIANSAIIGSPVIIRNWFKIRCTWWSAIGKTWVRIEWSSDGTSWTQVGGDVSDTIDQNNGSTSKVGVGLKVITAGQVTRAKYDQTELYGA